MSLLKKVLGAAGVALLLTASVHAIGTSTASTRIAATSARAASVPSSAIPGWNWLEFDFNPQRTGVGPPDTGIDAGNLRTLQTRVLHVDGTVDSSAVEVAGAVVAGQRRNVIVVTTTYGKTIAVDPDTGAKLWEYTPADISSYEGGAQITTATPLIDPDLQSVYAASPDGFIHKLALANGQLLWSTRVTYLPSREKIPSAFNLDGNDLIATTGGYDGDTPPYQGHVVVIDRGSGRILDIWNSLCSNRHYLLHPSSCPASDSAMWGRAGAVLEPGTGRILVATGNAPFNGRTDWGDSVLELTSDVSRLLHNWTPRDQAMLNSDDLDLGSTSPAILPEVDGWRLAVQGGKAGVLDLLNLNRLDGTTHGAGPRTGGQLQQLSSPGGDMVFTAPAVWDNGGRPWIFVADNSGTAAYVLRIRGHRPRLATVWQNGNGGTSPVLAGGLLYVYDPGGTLDVYQPANGRLLDSFPAAGGHWNSPIVANGQIVLPTGDANDHRTSGEIFIYHLPGE